MRLKALTIALYFFSLLAGLAMWLVPYQFDSGSANNPLNSATGFSIALSVSVAATLMHVLAVGLFVAGLRNFKTELKRPYVILCAGILSLAVAQLQLPFVLIFDAYWWFTSGLIFILHVAPNILLFIGMRSFANLMGITGRWTQLRFVLPAALGLAALMAFVPVPLSYALPSALAAHGYLGLTVWQLCMDSICVYIAWGIKQTMGGAYASAMKWLVVSVAAYATMNAQFLLLPYIGYDTTWYGRNGAYQVAFVVLGTSFVIAGYKFCTIAARSKVIPNPSPLDVVTYTASLATNWRDIDSIIDGVRAVTSKLAPEQALSPEQEQALGNVYLQLEDYLVNKEPLRKLTQAELRKMVNLRFPHEQNSPFWDAFNTSGAGQNTPPTKPTIPTASASQPA